MYSYRRDYVCALRHSYGPRAASHDTHRFANTSAIHCNTLQRIAIPTLPATPTLPRHTQTCTYMCNTLSPKATDCNTNPPKTHIGMHILCVCHTLTHTKVSIPPFNDTEPVVP